MRLDPSASSLPKRSEIDDTPGHPPGARWLWGQDDELGRLNLLTPERTAAAAKLIKSGQVVNLNLRADLPDPPVFGRERFKHTIKPLGGPGNDDLYELNTQSGSQWDGFRHVATKHNDEWIFYNGITQHDIETTSKMGMEPWAKHGIVGRGVLLDIWHFLKESYDPFTSRPITFKEIQDCAKAQKVDFQYGDILILRTGWVDKYLQKNQDERNKLGEVVGLNHEFVGVEQTQEVIDFLHDNYFSVVAGDQPGFEKWPPPKDPVLHSILLPLWGLPIGEMWDLEELAQVCRQKGQYTFFFASTPANVAGGVGSVSNAMAVF
ncbi:hypothetical protein M409DRAFT_65167 [Zasmidium cellare ATCC 36951]|uniref:Cyclase n=1 Tax=Zasmidium cellare ATCC 36951 TaxID=1080233 RepID=A0A6A6CSK3_ZASCE|nr:uncharacterized protein M409DRAFT_65167 [Zasmidium cellare ATCC 36951]KAF2168749.1 hypothetical protein M409DRAFT_65167 [Zasmidium cellare ATCC 36951]